MFKPKYVWKILRVFWNIHQDPQIKGVEFLQGNFLLVWILNLPTETNLLTLYMLQYTKDTSFTNNNASISMPPTPTHRALQSFPSTNMHRKMQLFTCELWCRHLLCCFCLHIEEEGRGCEYSGPFVVTNCGTLGTREERGGGSKNVQSCRCFTYKVETSFILRNASTETSSVYTDFIITI